MQKFMTDYPICNNFKITYTTNETYNCRICEYKGTISCKYNDLVQEFLNKQKPIGVKFKSI